MDQVGLNTEGAPQLDSYVYPRGSRRIWAPLDLLKEDVYAALFEASGSRIAIMVQILSGETSYVNRPRILQGGRPDT